MTLYHSNSKEGERIKTGSQCSAQSIPILISYFHFSQNSMLCVSGSAEERGSGPSGAPGGAHLTHRVHAFYPPPALLAAKVPRRAPPGSNVCINTSSCCFVIYFILKYFCLASFSASSGTFFPSLVYLSILYQHQHFNKHEPCTL